MSDADLKPAAEHGLPEVTWLWRRVFTYAVTLACLGLLWFVIGKITEVHSLERIAWGLIGVVVLQILFYTGGATLTDIWRLVVVLRTRQIAGKPPEPTP
jgi:hypothetical protein